MSGEASDSALPLAIGASTPQLKSRGYVATLTVPNRVESVRPAVSFLVQTARALNVPAAHDSLFEVAVNEALANAVKHGSRGNSDGVIVCELEIAPSQLIVRVIDNGPGFTVPAPTLPRITPGQPQALPERGYGVPIIQSVFPVVRAIRSNGRFGLELRLPII